jgi:hypothetical protein
MNTKQRRLCPVCGEKITIDGKTIDGRVIGSCGDAFWKTAGQMRAGIPTGPRKLRESSLRRTYTAPPQTERCTVNVILHDGSGTQCMHRATKNGRCWQHPISGQPRRV